MNKDDFILETTSNMMYANEWMDYSEALDLTHSLWEALYETDPEYLEEYEDGL